MEFPELNTSEALPDQDEFAEILYISHDKCGISDDNTALGQWISGAGLSSLTYKQITIEEFETQLSKNHILETLTSSFKPTRMLIKETAAQIKHRRQAWRSTQPRTRFDENNRLKIPPPL